MRSKSFKISFETDVQNVLNGIKYFCSSIGGTERAVHEVSTIASELAYNLLKYAPGGTLKIAEEPNKAVSLRSEDAGEGLKSGAVNCMREGFTSGSTLGLGLPSIVRLSDEFSMENSKSGTLIIVHKSLL